MRVHSDNFGQDRTENLMTEEITAEKRPAVQAAIASEDLSKAIEESLPREPDEQVKSVRVFNDCYRCNWWVKDKTAHAPWLSMGKIRKSSLLRVTQAADGLLIEVVGEGHHRRCVRHGIHRCPSA